MVLGTLAVAGSRRSAAHAVELGRESPESAAVLVPDPQADIPGGFLLIVLDTLNPTRLGCYGGAARTPVIDSLAAAGALFLDVWSETTVTAPSVATILTSRHLTGHGVLRNGQYFEAGPARLPELLRRHGFRTGGFVSNGEIDRIHGFYRGFDRFDDTLPAAERNRPLVLERHAPATVARAADWIASVRTSPFFCFVHLNDAHGPYDPIGGPPPPRGRGPRLPLSPYNFPVGAIPAYQRLPGYRHAGDYLSAYDAEIAQIDRALGTLFRSLRASSVAERTIVVLTADHGESLGAHNLWFQHGTSLNQEQLRVPLIIAGRGISPAVFDVPAVTADVMPTLLARAGIRLPGLAGRDLAPLLASGKVDATWKHRWRHALLSAPRGEMVDGKWRFVRAVSQDGWKLIRDRERHDVFLYHIATDPGETTDLAHDPAHRSRYKALDALLMEWEVRHPIPDHWKDDWLPPEKERARLRALGYLE